MKTKLCLTVLLSLWMLLAGAGNAHAHGNRLPNLAVQDTPDTLVPSGVTTYALVSTQNKIFWHTVRPQCPPLNQSPSAPTDFAERISRIATYGSLTRVLYEQGGCGASQFQSNIVA